MAKGSADSSLIFLVEPSWAPSLKSLYMWGMTSVGGNCSAYIKSEKVQQDLHFWLADKQLESYPFNNMARGNGIGVALHVDHWSRQERLPMPVLTGMWGSLATLGKWAEWTLFFLHNAQVFGVLWKTPVERNTNELKHLLAGFAMSLSLMHLCEKRKEVPWMSLRCLTIGFSLAWTITGRLPYT